MYKNSGLCGRDQRNGNKIADLDLSKFVYSLFVNV